MQTQHPTWSDLVGFELNMLMRPPRPRRAPNWQARLAAKLFAARYDRAVDAGASSEPGSALAAHVARLSAPRARKELAHALRLVLRDAVEGPDALRPRVPVRTDAVRRAADVVQAIVSRLEGPHRVRVRGMARLRMLLADGRGPLYRSGAGSLDAALKGALAAL
jgi:plasmid stabilization system protein ParE